MATAIKIGIVIVMLGIIASLGSSLVFLVRDRSRSRRTVNALTVRIGLSVALFLLIVLAMATGLIEPNPGPVVSGADGA